MGWRETTWARAEASMSGATDAGLMVGVVSSWQLLGAKPAQCFT